MTTVPQRYRRSDVSIKHSSSKTVVG